MQPKVPTSCISISAISACCLTPMTFIHNPMDSKAKGSPHFPFLSRTSSTRSLSTKVQSHPVSVSGFRDSERTRNSHFLFSLTAPEETDKLRDKLTLVQTYRNLRMLSRRAKVKKVSMPDLDYFKLIDKMKLRPEMSVFTHSRSMKRINFQQFGLGDNYATAVSVAISQSPDLQGLNFRNNRLKGEGALSLIETLRVGSQVREVDLSENELGTESVERLAAVLQGNSPIERLRLEKALLGKGRINMIVGAIQKNNHLVEIDLSRNMVSAGSAAALRSLLENNITLKVLDLHWNMLRGKGAVELFRGLAKNSTLEVLDVSWNSLGKEPSLETCGALARVFGENTSLKHLDLSNNYFNLEECEHLAQSILANHTILGIHMEGNDCRVDSKGFLVPDPDKRKDIESHISHRLLSPKRTYYESKTCWLCDHWQAVTLEWSIESVAWNRRLKHIAAERRASMQPVFVHLDIDQYLPELMEMEVDGTYRVTRAIPAEGTKLFFTYRGYAQVSNQYPAFAPESFIEKEISFFGPTPKALTVVLLNKVAGFGPICDLINDFPVLPRPIHWVYQGDPEDQFDLIPEWSIQRSIFRQYKLDTAELMQDCLDYDWTHSKMGSIFTSDEDQKAAKASLFPVYKDL